MTIQAQETRYRVEYDEYIDLDFDFESPAEKQALIDRLNRGDEAFFTVIKEAKCEHCQSWHHVDSLGGILASDQDEALTEYKQNHDETN